MQEEKDEKLVNCFKVFINIQDDNLNNPQRLTASEENVW